MLQIINRVICIFKNVPDTDMFAVFNVKVKLLHDLSSYQTVHQQLLRLLLVIANAISSCWKYSKGSAKQNK